MDYPIITEYQGYLIYEYQPGSSINRFQVFNKSGESKTTLCETIEEAKRRIQVFNLPQDGGDARY